MKIDSVARLARAGLAALALFTATAASALVCDVNNDGSIDRADIDLVFRAVGQTVPPGDLRDANGDGLITVVDARACTLRCSRQSCAVATNTAPVARADGYTTPEDSVLNVPAATGVLENDSDADGNSLTAVLVSGPASGVLLLNANGSFTYTPPANFAGSVSFTYRANDGSVNSNLATATIDVTPVNDMPTAVGDAYQTPRNTTLNVPAPGVLGNDTDPENNALAAALVSGPASGNLTLNANGSFVYVPAAGFSGSVSFSYRASDTTGSPSNVATVTIDVLTGGGPVANADSYQTPEDTALNVAGPGVLGNDTDPDNDPLTAVLASGPPTGTLVLNADGSFTYTPAPNATAPVMFTYRASDGSSQSGPANVTISIVPQNDAPVALDDRYSATAGVQLNVVAPGVLGNDSDVEGSPLTAVLVTPPASGTFALSSSGAFTYTPAAGTSGAVTFTYRARDGSLDSNLATVTINVSPPNNTAPVANADTYPLQEDTTLTVGTPGVLQNDSDPQNDALTAALVSGPASGSLTFNANGSFVYTPAANVNGPVTFTYRANDGALDSAPATVTLNIAAVNDPPAANAGPGQGGTVGHLVTLSGSCTDVDSASLTFQWSFFSRPSGSSATLSSATTATPSFTPDVTGNYVLHLVCRDGQLDSPASQTTVVVGSNLPVVSVAATTPNASEVGPAHGLFTFTRSGGNPAAALQVLFTRSGTATNGVDHQTISSSINIPANAATVTLPVTVLEDNVVEPTETVVITINANAAYSIGTANATVNIADSPAVVAVAATTQNASEVGPAHGLFTFTRSGGNLAAALQVLFTRSGTATNGVDHQTISSSINIPANAATVTLPVTVLQDNVVEPTETVIITINTNAAYSIGTASATVNIADSPAVVAVAATTQNASEVGPAHGLFTFTRSGGNLAAALQVLFTRSGTATNGVDHQTISSSINIPANETSVTLPVTVLQDNVVEPTETVIITINTNAAYSIGTANATVNIADSPAVVAVAATTPNASEVGPAHGLFTFTRSGGNLAAALQVLFTRSGTATNGVDHQTISSSINIPANQASVTLPVTVLQDNIVEPTETVVITINTNAAYSIGTASATVNIADSTTVVSVAATTPNASEVGPAHGLFTFTRSGGNPAAALQVLFTRSGTATNGVDHQTISSSINIPANQASVTLPVTVLQDNIVEPTETVIITIDANAAYSIGAASATVNIADSPAVVSIVATTPNASEAGPTHGLFTFTRSGGNLAAALQVLFTRSGTATNGVDHQTISSSINIPATQTSVTLPVTVLADASAEPTETVILTIDPNAAYTISATSATVFIADNVRGAITVTTSSTLLGVGRSITGTVTLSTPAPAGGLSVTVTSASPSIATVSGSPVAIAAGQSTGTFTLNGVAPGTATINATAPAYTPGSVNQQVTQSLISLGPNPTVAPGQTVGLAVSLSSPAPAGGVTINFTSSDTSRATITSSVFIPANATVPAANPQVTGVAFGTSTITASATGYASDTRTVTVTLTMTFSPNVVDVPAGGIQNTTLQLSSPAPAGGLTIGLSTSNPSTATVPSSVNIPQGQNSALITVTGVAVGTATLTATLSGVTPATATLNVSPATPITVQDTSIGRNAQVPLSVQIGQAAPPGNIQVTLTSADPARLLLSTNPNGAGSGSVTVQINAGSVSPNVSVYAQALAATGTVSVSATSPGYASDSAIVTLTPSGFYLGTGDFSTTPPSANTEIPVCFAQLNASGQNLGAAFVRGGLTPTVSLTSSSPSVGTVSNSIVAWHPFYNCSYSFAGNGNQPGLFDPLSGGTTTVSVVQPAGYIAPAAASGLPTSLVATVTAQSVQIGDLTVARNAYQTLPLQLDAPAPAGGVTVTVTSPNTSRVLLSTDVSVAGGASVTVPIEAGGQSSGVPIYVQALDSTGTLTLTATASGGSFASDTATVTFTRSGFFISNGDFSTTPPSANAEINVCFAQLDASNQYAGLAYVRGGLSVTLPLTSSNPGVGTVTNAVIAQSGYNCSYSFAGNGNQPGIFDPLSAGTTTISLTQPSGYFAPVGFATSVVATVSGPRVFVTDLSLGKDTQQAISIFLDTPAPAGGINVTVQSGTPSDVILSTDPGAAGTTSVVIPFAEGSQSPSVTVYAQALDNAGSVTLTATPSAPGFAAGTATVTLTRSGFFLATGDFSTTTLSPNSEIPVCVGQLDSANQYLGQAFLRGGLAVTLSLTSSNTNVGTVSNASFSSVAGSTCSTTNARFDPATQGSTTITLAQPAGFNVPSNIPQSIVVTVGAPSFQVFPQSPIRVGRNLQVAVSVSLDAPPPAGGIDITATSASSAVARVSLGDTTAGTTSVALNDYDQQSFTLYVQAFGAVSNSTTITLSAPGFTDTSFNVVIDPAGFVFNHGDFETPVGQDVTLTVISARLDTSTLNVAEFQTIRAGSTVTVPLTSSNTTVGTVPASMTFTAAGPIQNPVFEANAVGTSILTIGVPSGFSTPSNGSQVTANVN